MVQRIEAFRQVHVHNPVTPVPADKQLRLADGVVTTASRTIPVARRVKARVEDRLYDAAQRLLHNPVPYRRNAQQTLTTVILGDGYASDGLRPIALFLQLEQQARQLHLQIRLERTQALPIDSGRALVAYDVSEGFIQALF